MHNLEHISKNSLSQGIDNPETVEIRIGEVVPEIQIIEPQELHVGESQYELPDGYGSTRIVLMVRDPYWIHAYWEIAEDISPIIDKEFRSKGLIPTKKALRVHDVTDIDFNGDNSHRSVDIDIGEQAINWYINVDRANRSYCVELGFLKDDGRFICLSRSNIVKTPRDGISEVIDEKWMTIDEIEKYYPRIVDIPTSQEILSAISKRMHSDPTHT